MKWHYRILRHVGDAGREWYGLHEVFVEDGDLAPSSCTTDPVDFSADSVEALRASLAIAAADAWRDVIDFEAFVAREDSK